MYIVQILHIKKLLGGIQHGVKMTDWIGIPDNIENYEGFIYLISNSENDRYYIGQKKFWSKKKLKPLKGKSRCRRKRIESNWRDYYGSSGELLQDIKKYGKSAFIRRILLCCESKAVMNYMETLIQFKNHVLFDDRCYNKIINCRISENQIKNKKNHLFELIASLTPQSPTADKSPIIGSYGSSKP